MKTMKKKIIPGLLMAILAASIAGCGKGNIESRQETARESAPMEETAEEPVSEEQNDPPGKITLSENDQKDMDALGGMLGLVR